MGTNPEFGEKAAGLKTFAFDLDGTLCTLTDGNYETASPFLNRIDHVNKLGQMGHRILIFTARGATSKRDLRELTLAQLEKWGISFDELIMGKPHFDLLVDDKAQHSDDYEWGAN
jgi:ribonucleotide monophosphatase NagD (HAD superfamily)